MTQLDLLLDQVAEALLRGDMTSLAALSPAIEAETTIPADRATAERLQAKARRNERLLQAAARGVKAARLRLSEITSGPTLTTYDARGQKAQIAPVGLLPARRA